MLRILHLSYDYSTGPGDNKTIAVRALIDQTRQLAQCNVVSLDRVFSLKQERMAPIAPDEVAIQSFGLPYGLLFKPSLKRAAQKIHQAAQMGWIDLHHLDVIHCHKVTFEGYIGYLLAQQLGCSLFVSIRQTDLLLLKARPDLRPLAKRILQASIQIFYIVPYMIEAIKALVGDSFFDKHIRPKLVFLPNIVHRPIVPTDRRPPRPMLMTALRLNKKTVMRKNIRNLLRALAALNQPDVELWIIGDGDYLPQVRHWVQQFGIDAQVKFQGAVDNFTIDQYFANATAFVLPSFSETFGYVYAEALLNGTPILYSQHTGFDGLFEGVGVAVNPYSVASIRQGLVDVLRHNDRYRDRIQRLHAERAFEIFQPSYARNVYRNCLNQFFGSRVAAGPSSRPTSILNSSVELT